MKGKGGWYLWSFNSQYRSSMLAHALSDKDFWKLSIGKEEGKFMGGRGSGGHGKKSDKLKILQGTWRKDRSTGNYEQTQKKAAGKIRQRAPAGLSKEAQALWRQVVTGWELDAPSLVILQQACEALDELRTAQRNLARTGETAIDPRTGLEIPHPLCASRKEARTAFLRFWKELNLDFNPPE